METNNANLILPLPPRSDFQLEIYFALKKNRDRTAITGVLGSENSWVLHSSIDDWLQESFCQEPWTGFLAYNDEIPEDIPAKPSESWNEFGHTKGVLAWNDQKFGWLIHSVPKWPYLDKNQQFQLPHIPNPELKYGQSFAIIIGDRSLLDSCISQVYFMEAQVYVSTLDSVVPVQCHEQLPSIFHLSNKIKHLAKGKGWVHDFYEAGLPLVVGNGPFAVESWMRPTPHHQDLMPETEFVKHVQAITWPQLGPQSQVSYLEQVDHAKWAVSLNPSEPWVCIGDLNHMSFQSHRGGGGIIIYDHMMCLMFKELIDVGSNPIFLDKTQVPSLDSNPMVDKSQVPSFEEPPITAVQKFTIEETDTPLCHCGQPSQIRTSKTDKNPNRDFFTCREIKCEYFLWADTLQKAKVENVEKEGMKDESRITDTPSCTCGNASIIRTSHSEKNPNRDFYTCPNGICSYFMWVDKLQDISEEKLQAEKVETPLCRCGQPSQIKTSRTEKNPDRDYFTCKTMTCKYFLWADTQDQRTHVHNVENEEMKGESKDFNTPSCVCGNASIIRTSNSEKNPNRNYYACANAEKCSFFMWADKLHESSR